MKWEYRVIKQGGHLSKGAAVVVDENIEEMNKLGEEGGELVTTITHYSTYGWAVQVQYIFKRPKPEGSAL